MRETLHGYDCQLIRNRIAAAKEYWEKAAMIPASSDHLQRANEHHKQFGIPVQDASVYEPFGSWFDDELAKLVARWAHLAAPNATRRERALRRSRRSK